MNEKIEYYENSWWHRTANLLKSDAPVSEAGAPASSSSWFGSWFGGGGESGGGAPPATAAASGRTVE